MQRLQGWGHFRRCKSTLLLMWHDQNHVELSRRAAGSTEADRVGDPADIMNAAIGGGECRRGRGTAYKTWQCLISVFELALDARHKAPAHLGEAISRCIGHDCRPCIRQD